MTSRSESVFFTIPGAPIGKGRPRSRIAKGRDGKSFVSHYTPKATRQWEDKASQIARAAMTPRRPFTGPVSVTLTINITPPNSWPQWRKTAALNGTVRPTSKPDIDNIAKAVKDALNGIVYADDAQIVQTIQRKQYAPFPGIHVQVAPLPGAPVQAPRNEVDALATS